MTLSSEILFDYSMALLMHHEGGYVNDPDDAGGETKFGISKRAYPDLDIANLTAKQAEEIYYNDYWLKAKCDQLPTKLAMFHFDTAVNMGITAANKMLQKAIGVKADGIIGEITLAKANGVGHDKISLYATERMIAYSTPVPATRKVARCRIHRS